MYPKSCCDRSLSPIGCKERPSEEEIYTSGCLNQEMDFLLGTAYGIMILVILHFILEVVWKTIFNHLFLFGVVMLFVDILGVCSDDHD